MDQILADHIINWHQSIDRQLPWKNTSDPYCIWLSEIILQQTRVAQGLPYYQKFISTFPTIQDLASAPEDLLMQCWQGLGYYSRARNLHHTAKEIVDKYDGIFPNQYDQILALKGVGPYTAAAIASFAFNIPRAVVDGNVLRVVCRYYGIDAPIDDAKTVKQIRASLDELIKKYDPAAFNQAIMDFGAIQCSPKKPLCQGCPLQQNCIAYNENKIDKLPFKQKKLKKKDRYFHYFLVEQNDNLLLEKRMAKDIWQSLYQLPMIETTLPKRLKDKELKSMLQKEGLSIEIEAIEVIAQVKQLLSHQRINALIYEVTTNQKLIAREGLRFHPIEKLQSLGFPRLLDKFLSNRYPEAESRVLK